MKNEMSPNNDSVGNRKNRQKNSQLIELKTVFISLAHTLILVPYDYKTCIPYLNYLKCLIVQSSKTNPKRSVNTGR